jgi:hypothetical protein
MMVYVSIQHYVVKSMHIHDLGNLQAFLQFEQTNKKYYAFNENFLMKFYTYKKETIKENLTHQSFQFFLKGCGS